MVFDASKPIVRRGRPTQTASLETAAAEEAREVQALIAAREERLAAQTKEPTKDLSSAFDFRVTPSRASMGSISNPMFASRKAATTSSQTHSTVDARSKSFNSLTIPSSTTAGNSSNRNSMSSRRGSSPARDELCFKGAHRKLSEAALAQSGGTLGSLPMSAATKEAIEKDRVTKDHDPEAAIESESSDENEDSDEDEHQQSTIGHANQREPMTLAQAAENERMDIIRNHTHDTLQRQSMGGTINKIVTDNSPAANKKKPIHPNTSYTDEDGAIAIGRPTFEEDEYDPFEDIERDMTILQSDTHEENGRLICTIQRADFDKVRVVAKRTRNYLVSVDLSPQANYALEWTIGTVMRDGDTTRIVHVLEYDEKEDKKTDAALKAERLASMHDILIDSNLFLKRTWLSVKIEIEVIHHHNPKHLITEVIDTTMPTMVIIGSRGRSNMSGIMLGSFSNYIVNKSSVPVMVARKRLRRGSKKRKTIPPPTSALQFPNNNAASTFSRVRKID